MSNFYYFFRYILIFAIAVTLLYQGFSLKWRQYFNLTANRLSMIIQKSPLPPERNIMLNVFIHGSFGSTFGVLSLSKVLDDNISGTSYRETNRRLRQDDFFFTEQPILERGLIRINPSFDLCITKGKKYAAYPIIKAFDLVDEIINKQRHTPYYYTFGWTGLISQNSRRYEAIRLYNALEHEVDKLKKQGFTPKIRLITHSHGGNLCLNLAAIHTALQVKSLKNEAALDKDTKESLRAMMEIMKKLPNKKNAQTKKDQKAWDFMPLSASLVIDELILFGTPIQPETQGFCSFPLFNKIFNFYSKQDFVQRFDCISTKRYFSDQRFSKKECLTQPDTPSKTPKIIQAQISIGKRWSKNSTEKSKKSPEKTEEKTVPWWRQLFFIKKEEGRISDDPTHKELWFLSWTRSPQEESLLGPLPVVILTPFFLQAIESLHDINDIDINILKSTDSIKVQIAHHEQDFILGEQKLQRQIIETIKTCINDWRVGEKTHQEEFYAAYKHLAS